MAAVLEYLGAGRTYDSTVAVKRLDLELKEEEVLVLIGRSGCGKTTALRMANGLVFPSSGQVNVFGKEVRTWPLGELRAGIGYVVQEIGLFPHMTVVENMGLLARLRGWNARNIRARAEALLSVTGLEPRQMLDAYPRDLSGGQAQRVGVARALMLSPRLVLMDEPFGALDPITRRQLQAEFLGLRKEIRASILMVTHDMSEAFRLGDRIAVMDRGELVQVGKPADLTSDPRTPFVSEFLGA